jgi:CheY-like chemotaxis protein
LGLPQRDGFEVMRAVRACDLLQQSQVPIIITSARAIDDAAAQVCRHCNVHASGTDTIMLRYYVACSTCTPLTAMVHTYVKQTMA